MISQRRHEHYLSELPQKHNPLININPDETFREKKKNKRDNKSESLQINYCRNMIINNSRWLFIVINFSRKRCCPLFIVVLVEILLTAATSINQRAPGREVC